MDELFLDDAEMWNEFKLESQEHLEGIEDDLLALEQMKEKVEEECVNRIFRAIHTIKGTSGFMGFKNIGALSHVMEAMLVRLRNGSVTPTGTMISELLKGVDTLRGLLECLETSDDKDVSEQICILDEWAGPEKSLSPAPDQQKEEAAVLPVESVWAGAPKEYDWHFRILLPNLQAWQRSNKKSPVTLFTQLEEHGFVAESYLISAAKRVCDVTAEAPLALEILYATDKSREMLADSIMLPVDQIGQLEEGTHSDASNNRQENSYEIAFTPAKELAPGALDALWQDLEGFGPCEISRNEAGAWRIVLQTSAQPDDIRNTFIFVENGSTITIRALGDDELKECTAANSATDVEAELQTAPSVSGKQLAGNGAERPAKVAGEMLRVPAERLDRLVNLVGELVIVQAQLKATSARAAAYAPELQGMVEGMERLNDELRDVVLNIRMMPIGTAFNKYRRLVRDLCRDLHKEVDVVIQGAETELDKSVIDQLGDPLLHMIRNSLDHGIETPAEREAAGKKRTGQLRLAAEQLGDRVLITVADDGAGLNLAAIRTKALERELILPKSPISDSELQQLIFNPGFSTAKVVTNVSGRGVGMDVVKKQIEQLQGVIKVESKQGRGTVFQLSLPLTLAIIDGLMVEVDDECFIVPLSIVRETVEITPQEKAKANARNLVDIRGSRVPYLSLRELFGFGASEADLERVVVVEIEDKTMGLIVDRVIGNHQTVLKSLGRFYRELTIYSGATIRGDGTVALILDVSGLIAYSKKMQGDTTMFAV